MCPVFFNLLRQHCIEHTYVRQVFYFLFLRTLRVYVLCKNPRRSQAFRHFAKKNSTFHHGKCHILLLFYPAQAGMKAYRFV